MYISVTNCLTPDKETNKPFEIQMLPDSIYARISGKGNTYELALKDYTNKVKQIIDELNKSLEKLNEKEETPPNKTTT